MKKSLLAIVLAAAVMPLTFAQAPAPASPPAQRSEERRVGKEHKKNSKKAPKKDTGSATSTPSK